MKEIICSKLGEIEADEKVKVLYACESGSRAWGFPSADSDYDVRFIYLHPLEWYLSIYEQRDVIELPINDTLDINGWDLKKALQLFRKSNPPLLEWLNSPIVYLDRYDVATKLRQLAALYYSPAACLYHYRHMAFSNFRSYLQGEQISPKKYFYVLRPILAMNWIEMGCGTPPTDFNVLVHRLVTDPHLKTAIDQLLEAKRSGMELDSGRRIEPISTFIERELARWETQEITSDKRPIFREELDGLFIECLKSIWQN